MSNTSLNNDNALVVKNVSKIVSSPEGKLTILSDINFIVTKGESVAIVGASGAGKSTLLGLMAGLDSTTKGRIFLNGHDLTDMNEDGRASVRAKNVGFVFQSFHLIPSLNALENVMLPLELIGKQSAKKIAKEILFELGLKARASHYPTSVIRRREAKSSNCQSFCIRTRPFYLQMNQQEIWIRKLVKT